jgi:hypothetical protein
VHSCLVSTRGKQGAAPPYFPSSFVELLYCVLCNDLLVLRQTPVEFKISTEVVIQSIIDSTFVENSTFDSAFVLISKDCVLCHATFRDLIVQVLLKTKNV